MNSKIFTEKELELMGVSIRNAMTLDLFGVDAIFSNKEKNGIHLWICGMPSVSLDGLFTQDFKRMLTSNNLMYVYSSELEKCFIFTKNKVGN